jgi:O-antigen ligase
MVSQDSGAKRLWARLPAVALAALPFVSFPWGVDAGESARAAVLALVCALALVAVQPDLRLGPRGKAAAIALSITATIYLVAALASHPASSLWGVHGRFQGLVSAAIMICAGIAAYQLLAHESRTLSRAMAVASASEGVFIVYQRLSGHVPSGTMVNPAMSGGWLAVAVVVVTAAAFVERGRIRWMMLGAAALGVLGLGLLGSRGAWLGVLAGIAVVFFGLGRSKGRSLVWGLAIVLLVGVLAGGATVLSKVKASDVTQGSAATRLLIWRGTVHMIADHPVIGVGPGRFLYTFPAYQPARQAAIEGPDVRIDQAHSVYLQTAAEAGIPVGLLGLALAALALAAAAACVRARSATGLVTLAGLTAFLVQGVFGISTLPTDGLAWALGGMAFACADTRDAKKPVVKGERRRWEWAAASVAAVALGLACVYYVGYDIPYARGLAAFDRADLTQASAAFASAVRGDPLVDLYRVSSGDAARFLAVGDPAKAAPVLRTLETGLRLEPDSYDLALARARLLSASGAPADSVLAAYDRALELFPLGYTVRIEAAGAARRVGDETRARRLETAVDRLFPNPPAGGQR